VDDVCHALLVLFTTKDTKSTKFGVLIILTLRVLRALRGENIFTVNPEEPKKFTQLVFSTGI
jgi:hypothetical protein